MGLNDVVLKKRLHLPMEFTLEDKLMLNASDVLEPNLLLSHPMSPQLVPEVNI